MREDPWADRPRASRVERESRERNSGNISGIVVEIELSVSHAMFTPEKTTRQALFDNILIITSQYLLLDSLVFPRKTVPC
jgi:hypothetical protein